MRILLFVFNIYNTIDGFESSDYRKLEKLINTIAERDFDQKIVISICDDTDNKELAISYLKKFMKFDKFESGPIFLNDTYYKDNKDGAHLYEENLTKEEKIVKYVNELESNENYINMYYISGNDIDFYKFHELNKNISCKIINESNKEIINVLKGANYCLKYKRD